VVDSTARKSVRKPRPRQASRPLPHPDFPLFHQGSGRWAKKVRGKLHYFGKVADDPNGDKALTLWLAQKDDLLAGRTPREGSEGLTVEDLCFRFLQVKEASRDAGEITARTWADYLATAKRVAEKFGRNRLVADLASDDFESLRASISTTWGPVALGNEIQRVRVIFKYAHDAGLIDLPVRYGPQFKRPSKKVMRLAKARKGAKLNCGFGNSDCGTLPLDSLDLDGGWIDYHRPKTGIDRRCPLWPETVKALRESIAKRPAASDEASLLVFITRCGASWAKETADNPITKEFRKLLDDTGLHRDGLGFYSLRHIFRTVADEARDQPAANSIMGHADGSMAGVYRERISDDRLQAVVDQVRLWLLAKPKSKGRTKAKTTAEQKLSVDN
jgi:integrase